MSMMGNLLAISQDELNALYEAPENISTAIYETYKGKNLEIGKEWHAIHFMLTGKQYGGKSPLANVIFGIKPIGDEDDGYGPALGTSAANVKDIASAIVCISEAEFRAKYNADALNNAEIYPQDSWDEEAIDYLTEQFKAVQQFYKKTAENEQAVITYIN